MLIILYVEVKPSFMVTQSKTETQISIYFIFMMLGEKKDTSEVILQQTRSKTRTEFPFYHGNKIEHPCNLRIRKNGLLFKKEMFLFF